MELRIAEAIAAYQQGHLERAQSLALDALEENPGSPPLHHLLGLIECRSGKLENGIGWLRRAFDADSSNIPFQVMLMRALVDGGRPQDALDVAAPPAGTTPAELTVWHARAEAANAAQDHEAAAQSWARIANAKPSDWRAWSNYGNVLAAQRRWPEAATALRRALQLNPREDPIRRNLASALVESKQIEEAAPMLQNLVEFSPADAVLRLLYAQVLSELKRYDESLAEFDEAARLTVGGSGNGIIAMAIKPGQNGPDPDMVRKLGVLLERTNRMDDLKGLLEQAESRGISREQLGYPAAAVALRDRQPHEAKRLLLLSGDDGNARGWHRLMTRIDDALGDFAGAFAEAEAMNHAVDDFAQWRERGAAYRKQVRGLAGRVTPEWCGSLPSLPTMDRRAPAFLVGFPRSGTTLLDTFLMGHPDVAVLEEVHMLGAAERALGSLADLPHRSHRELETGRSAYFEELDRHVDPTFTGLVVDKLPLNMLGLPFIYGMFPHARVIFAQRHPADAVLSAFMQDFVLNDAMASFLTIEDAADLYDAAMDAFSKARDSVGLPIHTLVYERLVEDPGRELKPLIHFLGLEWRDELLDHQATAQSRGAILTPSYDQVTQPLTKAPAGRWTRYQEELAPVLPKLLTWADRLGY